MQNQLGKDIRALSDSFMHSLFGTRQRRMCVLTGWHVIAPYANMQLDAILTRFLHTIGTAPIQLELTVDGVHLFGRQRQLVIPYGQLPTEAFALVEECIIHRKKHFGHSGKDRAGVIVHMRQYKHNKQLQALLPRYTLLRDFCEAFLNSCSTAAREQLISVLRAIVLENSIPRLSELYLASKRGANAVAACEIKKI